MVTNTEEGCGHEPAEGEVWYGCPGHFIATSHCIYHLHTHYGPWCISTVGDYRHEGQQQTLGLGSDSFYETMVFDVTADGSRWTPTFMARYAVEPAAQRGHYETLRRLQAGADLDGDDGR